MLITRRALLQKTGLLTQTALLATLGCSPRKVPKQQGQTPQVRFPGKVPMGVINDRPPCLETPWRYYRYDLTPNDAFFVRWHLQAFPQEVDIDQWRLHIDGAVDRPLSLSLSELRTLGDEEVIAVNQCSGNSRSLFEPRVPGAQWGNGAMGNARWSGVSLARLLKKAGVQKGAVQVIFDGLDEGPLSSVPDFVKSLSIEHALQSNVMIAIAMNNEPIPMLNGFPARLVVPGYYATYWVKSLHKITVNTSVYDGYWMAKAYKLPASPNGCETPDKLSGNLVPISRLNVRSFFTSPDPDQEVTVGKQCELDGIAFDGGDGIGKVEVSTDAGTQWSEARLDPELGRYSFRRWRYTWTPENPGSHVLKVRATTRSGQTQLAEPGWNRGGFMRNVIEELRLHAV